MESTELKRVWHSGPPPHVGWWNASTIGRTDMWRWWDGAIWSIGVDKNCSAEIASDSAKYQSDALGDISWNDYWPEGARVPRVNPNEVVVKVLGLPQINQDTRVCYRFDRLTVELKSSPVIKLFDGDLMVREIVGTQPLALGDTITLDGFEAFGGIKS